MEIELRHMRHFVTVAEELHFGRAAARLGMAQPPLSQSIQRLETALGFKLFARTQRRVELTPAGRVFLDESRRTLSQADATVTLSRQAASDDTAELHVTFVSAALYRVLPVALRQFRSAHPLVRIRLDELATDPQIESLKDGTADLGFVTPPFRSTGGLEVVSIHRDPIVVAVPASSILARRDHLELSDLAEENFVLFPYKQGPTLHSRIMAACRRAGFLPHISQEARLMHTILSLVGAEMGVSLVPDGARTLGVDGVRFVPLSPVSEDLSWELSMAWRARGMRRPLRDLIDLVLASGKRP